MSVIIPLAAIVTFIVGAVVWKIRDNAAHRGSSRDETVRAGRPARDEQAVAGRAEASVSWVRLSDPAGP